MASTAVTKFGLVTSLLVGMVAPLLEVLNEGGASDSAPLYAMIVSLLGVVGTGLRYAINAWREQQTENRTATAAEAEIERKHQLELKKLDIEQRDRESESRTEALREIFGKLSDIKADVATLKDRNVKVDGS